jgi:hypothetical protein
MIRTHSAVRFSFRWLNQVVSRAVLSPVHLHSLLCPLLFSLTQLHFLQACDHCRPVPSTNKSTLISAATLRRRPLPQTPPKRGTALCPPRQTLSSGSASDPHCGVHVYTDVTGLASPTRWSAKLVKSAPRNGALKLVPRCLRLYTPGSSVLGTRRQSRHSDGVSCRCH